MPEDKFEYIHIGRTAGTAFRLSISSNPTLSQKVNYNKHNITLPDLSPKSKIIFCVRDPVDRFVSGFYQRKNKLKRHISENQVSSWCKKEVAALDSYQDINHLLKELFSTDKIIRKNCLKKITNIMHIGRYGSYWYWFKENDFITLNKSRFYSVLLHEKFEESMMRLIKKLGVDSLDIVKSRSISYDEYAPIDNNYRSELIQFLQHEYMFIQSLKNLEIIPNNYLINEINECKKRAPEFNHYNFVFLPKLKKDKLRALKNIFNFKE